MKQFGKKIAMKKREEGQHLEESNLNLEEDDFAPNFTEVNELTGTSKEDDFISCSSPTDLNQPTDMVNQASKSSKHVSGEAVDHDPESAEAGNSKLHQKRTLKQSKAVNATKKKKKFEISEDALDGLCQFHCSICQSTYTGWDEFCYHMRKRHEKTPKRADHEKYIYSVILHVCKMCPRKILCDCGFLDSHMKSKHQISLSEYRQQYKKIRKPEIQSKKDNENRNKEVLEAGELSIEKLGNMCRYTCPHCNIISSSFFSFARHGKTSKECSLEVQINEFFKYATKVVTHQCRFCSEFLACDISIIANHVRKHGMKTIKHYSEKTGCQLVGVTSRVDKATMHKLFKGAKTTTNVGNLCKYSCDKCGHIEKSWHHMKIHMKTSNHWATTGAGWSEYIVDTVLHQCEICQKQLPNDKSVVGYHLKRAHALSLSKYSTKCELKILKSGNKVLLKNWSMSA